MDFSRYPVTIILIAANVVFSLIGFSSDEFLYKTIGWPYYEKNYRQYYRFISSGFLHADWGHLFFNMFTLFSFGSFLETIFSDGELGGKISYLLLYFTALIVSSLPSFIKYNKNENYRSLGASGAVSAIVFATIIFVPWSGIELFGIRALRVSAALYAILYLVYCVYAGRRKIGRINHDAHLWGALYGLAFTGTLIAVLRPDLFTKILAQLENPSIFGR